MAEEHQHSEGSERVREAGRDAAAVRADRDARTPPALVAVAAASVPVAATLLVAAGWRSGWSLRLRHLLSTRQQVGDIPVHAHRAQAVRNGKPAVRLAVQCL